MPDRAAGYLRFSSLLGLLAREHSVTLCTLRSSDQEEQLGPVAFSAYRDGLLNLGVTVAESSFVRLLRKQAWDALLFEFYRPAMAHLEQARYRQPGAHMIVDSVDVHFRRFAAKARMTGEAADHALAERVQREELQTYRRADLVIVVTEDDKGALQTAIPGMPTLVVPTIHTIFKRADPTQTEPNSLVFVGGFQHEPNVDAMLYFCAEVLPLVRSRVPGVRLCIVGTNPPPAILALASDRVEVTGYVPDTAPYLEKSRVSIAPLRYGAGMKGKIGEAMARGLPVVTTSVGAEGFGLTPGEHLLVGDTAEDFAAHIVRLLWDEALYERIRCAGWDFVRAHYSVQAVESIVRDVMVRVAATPIRKLPPLRHLRLSVIDTYEKHIGWRLR